MSKLAIVVVPPPPPPPNQSGCDYSIPINPNSSRPTYKCYTSEEYQQMQTAKQHDAVVDIILFTIVLLFCWIIQRINKGERYV